MTGVGYLAALCAWRITHLLQAEDGPWDFVVRLRRRAGTGFWGDSVPRPAVVAALPEDELGAGRCPTARRPPVLRSSRRLGRGGREFESPRP
jgi:hypothetical protein